METREDEGRCSVSKGSGGPLRRVGLRAHVSREREVRR